MHGSDLVLQPIWELFAEQGFAEGDIAPGMCRLKEWEASLGVSVVLPQVLAGLTHPEISQCASGAPLSAEELKGVLKQVTQRPSRNTLCL